ncbi:glycosyltransferase family 39 protein, partial [Candidatus Peregrinibacteria bacterium]|nr:glycosyltransferase family 39 protein [Candidatus Peregrinibacteria bacterium]
KISQDYKPDYSNFNYTEDLGYPLLLGGIWLIIGIKKYIYIGIFQIILEAFACVCVFSIGKRLFSSRTGFLAGLMYSLYIFEAQFSVIPHPYAIIGTLIIFGSWFITRIENTKTTKKSLLMIVFAGSILGLATLIRSSLILLPAMAAIYILFHINFKKAIVFICLLFLSFSLVMAPLIIRNKIVFGEARAVRKSFWHTVMTGFGQFPNPWELVPVDGSVVAYVHNKYGIECCGEAYESVLRDDAIKAIKSNPVWYFGMVLERISMSLFPFHFAMTRGKITQETKDGQPVFYTHPYDQIELIFAFISSVWVLIAIIGAILSIREWRKTILLILIWAYFLGVHSLTFTHPNYMVPLSFVYALFSAYTVDSILSKMHDKYFKASVG